MGNAAEIVEKSVSKNSQSKFSAIYVDFLIFSPVFSNKIFPIGT